MGERKEIGYAEDDQADSYTWNLARVIEEDGCFSIVTDGGCSCNCPEDSTGGTTDVGPCQYMGDLMVELLKEGEYLPSYNTKRAAKLAFLDAVERQWKTAHAAIKKELGIE